ncbi:MAG: endonuclease III domain-containing protein [Candidatus Altiarchaeota archaeon]|nr:endonuclease III domain-containing protein [Candidatus Altiarchaeota archaeon]
MDLLGVYDVLFGEFGSQGWWPAESEFEMVVGAILTQCTSWGNVEKALDNLRGDALLSPEALYKVDYDLLRRDIKPSGYFNAKAEKIKAFMDFLYNGFGGSLELLLSLPVPELRERLLSIHGIGPETADSIILYAAHKPSFVVDAYTRRIFSRLGLVDESIKYDDLKGFFERNLPQDVELYNEYHALIVELGKCYCRRSNPRCGECPLKLECGLD